MQFWRSSYSSDLMKLVICSNHSFEEMEGFAECFSGIARNGGASKKGKFGAGPAADADFCFVEDAYLQKIVQMAPLDDLKELSIFVNLPPSPHLFRMNPYSLVEFVFTNPEPGSLLARLKNEGLAFTLAMDCEYFTESTRAKIRVGLTELGCRAYHRVLDLISLHLQCMDGERDFARLKRVQEESFRIHQPSEPLDLAEELAAGMQMFPVEHVMDHAYLYELFDAGLIRSLVRAIGDFRCWVIVVVDNKGAFDRREKYCSVEYRIIGEYAGPSGASNTRGADGMPAGSCVSGPVQDAALGFGDRCFADRYLDKMHVIELGGRFVKTERFNGGLVSYVFDQEFAIPKSRISILLKSARVRAERVSLELYLRLAEDMLSEKYARELFNFHLAVEASVIPEGVLIKVEGVSDRIPEMCRCFFSELASVQPGRFDLFRKQKEDAYTKRITGAPFGRLLEMFRALKTGFSSAEQRLAALETVGAGGISFLRSYWTEVVAVGNIHYSDVLDVRSVA